MIDNLAQLLLARAAQRPGLTIGTIDDPTTLATAIPHAAAVAEQLAQTIAPGERVMLIADTSTDYLISWMGCILAGNPVGLVNPTYPDDLSASMIAGFAPGAVLLPRKRDPGALDWHGPTLLVDDARQRSATPTDSAAGVTVQRLDVASYMHTSGTTGQPKFCVQSHSYFLKLAADVSQMLELKATDRVFAPLPMFHINPMGYGLIGALWAGSDVLAASRFSASTFWANVAQQAITALILHAPPVAILSRRDASEFRPHSVRTMFYADRTFMDRFTVPTAVSGYGSTEAGGLSHMRRWSTQQDIPLDASRHGGEPRAGIQWRLRDDGQIAIRATEPGVLFDGYLRDGGVVRPFDDQGWFHTGDFGRREPGGELVFLERASESIRVRGEFVPIQYVEKEIGQVPGITDLALWKRPGALVDEDVVLYVVAEQVPLSALRQATEQLPGFMRPSMVIRTGKLPRDAAAGKVQRRLLAEQPVLEEVPL
ncbi:MAG: class I adenylate-forming enzyme family protein [Beutenbergiaceae bacterium]